MTYRALFSSSSLVLVLLALVGESTKAISRGGEGGGGEGKGEESDEESFSEHFRLANYLV